MRDISRRLLLPAACAVLGACAALRWSGAPPGASRDELHPPPAASPEPAPVTLAAAPRAARPPVRALPEASPAKRARAVFPSDLGPDEIDLAELPLQQRHDFRIYARACSRCHDLARSLWAPHTQGPWVEFYLVGMRVRGRVRGRPLSAEEVAAAKAFLLYDAAGRKRGKEFEAQTEELARRFDALVDERMGALQRSSPVVRP